MNIAVLSIYEFPFGGAATSRIIAYSKSLLKNDVKVDVFSMFPVEPWKKNRERKPIGNFEGINYYFTFGVYRSRYRLINIVLVVLKLRRLLGFLSAAFRVYKYNRSKNYDAIIISTDMILALWIFGKLGKLIDAKSVFIFDEFPIPIRHYLKSTIPNWKKKGYRFVLKGIDAYISISKKLEDYYCKFAVKPTFLMPVIVDATRFEKVKNTEELNLPEEFLCYMGNLELAKDNVHIIIEAFSQVKNKYPKLVFLIFGQASPLDKELLINLIQKLNLEDRVFLKGRVNYDLVPSILMQAKILVSSQPDTKRASGGFPTKLAEYLLAGKPALFTNVGENTNYVEDKEHCFFVEPNNVVSYAKKIAYILDNYQICLSVAKQGKEHILKNYSDRIIGMNLKKFFNTI